MMKSDAEENAKDTLINPYWAVSFADHVFSDSKLDMAKEDWVLSNTKLIEDMGASEWLEQLLIVLSVKPTKDTKDLIVSPSKVVDISSRLKGKHESSVDITGWLNANEKLIKELGTGDWLWRLLKVLQTGGAVEL